jgi:hypothetical protein
LPLLYGSGSVERALTRGALKHALRAAARPADQAPVAIQPLAQALPPTPYARLQKATKRALRRQRIALPKPSGFPVVILWGVAPGEETTPSPRRRYVPPILGDAMATEIRGDDGIAEGAFLVALPHWLDLAQASGPVKLAPPVLEVWTPQGVHSRRVWDFGLDFPLPPLSGAA